MDGGMTRRGILGSLGALALAKVPFPWQPKPTDIVIASEMPPETVNIPGKQQPENSFEWGMTLYDKNGREVAVITDIDVRRDAIEIGSHDGFRQYMPGLWRGELRAMMLPPFTVRQQGSLSTFRKDGSVHAAWDAT